MEGLYKGFKIIKNHFHTSNQQRQKLNIFNPRRWVLFVEMRFLTALVANDDDDDDES